MKYLVDYFQPIMKEFIQVTHHKNKKIKIFNNPNLKIK